MNKYILYVYKYILSTSAFNRFQKLVERIIKKNYSIKNSVKPFLKKFYTCIQKFATVVTKLCLVYANGKNLREN